LQFAQLLVVAFLPGEVLLRGYRPERAVGRLVVLSQAAAHAQVEHALEVVNPFGLADEFVVINFLAGHRVEDIHVILDVLGDLGGRVGFVVIRRHNVVPGQFAQAAQAKPGAEHGVVEQGVGFIFEGWDLVVDHVHENQPGFVVLGAFVGEREAALLRQALFVQVFGVFQTFVFHADIFQQLRVCAKALHKNLFQAADT